MTYRVVVTRRAERDMHDAAGWWATNRSPEQANRWLSGLERHLQSLSKTPTRYAAAAESDQFPFELRELHYGPGRRSTHRVLFTIADELVLVLTVRHVAQDRLDPEDLSN
jgi:plasmid stabilization system protein ParE